MKLYSKLVITMMSLLIIAMVTLFILNQYSQNDLVDEIQESSTEVSKAIQISVEGLTSEYETETSRLIEYLKEAKNKGINEINIISNEGEIIDSSDPAMVGKKKEIKKLQTGLKASKFPKGIDPSMHPYDLVVPVIVGDQQLGYVQINLLLDNIREIQHKNFLKRLLATSMVFLLGISIIIFLAKRYTNPINKLTYNVKQLASGNLTVTFPVDRNDEIGQLGECFNEMVEKLRERENLEKRLYEAEHLSKVGRLASGIAHEIRNPLNYISLAIDHLKADYLSSCPGRQDEISSLADKIKEEVKRANYMVLNFMNYGRPLKLRYGTFSYAELVDKALPLLHDSLEEKAIRIEKQIAPSLPMMTGDQEMLRNCILNFITNAMQALPYGGIISLGASFDCASHEFTITFADNGVGIPEEDIEQIFQPYFTTREAGIGLGLAISERVIRGHGGTISVASRVGNGTTFTVTLPEIPTEGQQDTIAP